MEPWRLSVHPIYGAIYRDGEFVQRGAILGLNTQANGVVVAPASGWVRLVRASASGDPLKSSSESAPQNAATDAARNDGIDSSRDSAKDSSKEARVDYILVEIWPQTRT